jgi:hypothetical protein
MVHPDSGGAGNIEAALPSTGYPFFTDVTWARYADRQKFSPRTLWWQRGDEREFILNPGLKGTETKIKRVAN